MELIFMRFFPVPQIKTYPDNWILYEEISAKIYIVIRSLQNVLPQGTYTVYEVIVWDDYNEVVIHNRIQSSSYFQAKDSFEELQQEDVKNLYLQQRGAKNG